MVKVDKGIKLPPSRSGTYRWPWVEMEVGDSFFVTANGKEPCPVGAPPPALIQKGFKILRRTVYENDVRGFRIWRVE